MGVQRNTNLDIQTQRKLRQIFLSPKRDICPLIPTQVELPIKTPVSDIGQPT